MQLKLHNTLSRQKELFEPIDPERITMYVCGPTVYNYVHIGNGRPAVVFDVLFRLLQVLYPKVSYVANVTDIDDKINRQALANGEPIQALTDRFTDAYNDDMAVLGILQPPIGVEVFAWGPFAARMAAGVYLSMVFVGRGFGIAVGCHAAHNIALLWIGSYWLAK